MVTEQSEPDPLNVDELIRQVKAWPPFRLSELPVNAHPSTKPKSWQRLMEERKVKGTGWK